jgi:hypothetical protein
MGEVVRGRAQRLGGGPPAAEPVAGGRIVGGVLWLGASQAWGAAGDGRRDHAGRGAIDLTPLGSPHGPRLIELLRASGP